MKRKLLALLAGLPLLAACVPVEVRAARKANEERRKAYYDSLNPKEQATLQRFRGIGIQLVVDAVEGVEMGNVRMANDLGYYIFGSPEMGVGGVSSKNRSTRDVGSARVPLWVRVTWGKPIVVSGDWDTPIIGDYTIRVADRIPDEVVESLRKDPHGSLRIKFRLHPKGVYFGWDIEQRPGYKPGYSVAAVHGMPGGDFQEAKIFNGAVVRKGWYIDKNGQKIETDY